MDYWDKNRLPRVKRIIFDNTVGHKEAVELVKTEEGRVDLVTELRPLDTLRVAQSPFGKVVKNRGEPPDGVRSLQYTESGEPVERCTVATSGEFGYQSRRSDSVCHQREWRGHPRSGAGTGFRL